jgi:hypothetical protein
MFGSISMISHDLMKADQSTLNEVLREAEAYLAAQLTSALASNQRAISFTNFMAAAAAAIGSGAAGLLTGTTPKLALGVIAAAVALGLLAAMAFAIAAAMPTQFWFAGNTPAQWVDDVLKRLPYKTAISQQLSHYANMIERNNLCLARCDERLKWSLGIAWVSLTLGAVAAISWITFVLSKTGILAAKFTMLFG